MNIEHFEAELLDLLKKHSLGHAVVCFPKDLDLGVLGVAIDDPVQKRQAEHVYGVIQEALHADLRRRRAK